IAEEYKHTEFDQVHDCRQYFVENYGISKMTLNLEEFDDVFSIILGDTEAHFNLFDSFQRGKVNIFEVFAGAYMFSEEKLHGLDAKIESCFELFDFDESGNLNEVELELMFEAIIMGISKISKIPLPYASVVSDYVARLFQDSGKDSSMDSITLGELKQWVSEQAELLAMVGKFTDARLIVMMKKKVDEGLARAMQEFDAAAAEEPEADGRVALERTAAMLSALPGTPATEGEVRSLRELLASVCGQARVGREQYRAAVEPWVAFGVMDEDGSRALDEQELKALMWIAEGVDTPEPFDKAVRAAVAQMDRDGSGQIDRLEWITFNTLFDPTTGCVRPGRAIKADFEALDTDGSGNISAIEMSQILKKALAGVAEKAAEEGRAISASSEKIWAVMVSEAAAELVDLMDASGNGMVEYDEFRRHQVAVSAKVKQLRDFALRLV
ncbi:unnamed protein product, partial [Heterosigma akashiwo]